MKNLILIKLGGSVITDKAKRFSAREKTISALAREIKAARKKFSGKIIVGHGAGSFAHIPAHKYQTKKGLVNKNSLFGASVTEDAARQLNTIVIKNFLKEKLPVFPFSPASFLTSDIKGNSKFYLDAVKKALEIDLIPVVYGDVVMDEKTGFTIFSTEKVLSVLAKELRSSYKIRIIYVTDVDGVYDENKKTILVITGKNFTALKKSVLGAKGVDVTGGMVHKVEESLALAVKYKVPTLIINGNKKGNLKKAIAGKKVVGTRIQNP